VPLNPTTDLDLRFSVPTSPSGTPLFPAGNSLPQRDPAKSLGGWISTTSCRVVGVNGFFPALSGDDNTAGAAEYRCIFLANLSSTYTWKAVVAWLAVQSQAALLALGVDPTSASPLATILPQARTVTTTTQAPQGVVFASPSAQAQGIVLGDLAPGYCRALWLRRSGAATLGHDPDAAVVQFSGTSLE
jgi:hypothetical protein